MTSAVEVVWNTEPRRAHVATIDAECDAFDGRHNMGLGGATMIAQWVGDVELNVGRFTMNYKRGSG